jgi:intein/homing endonuclease
MIEMKEITLTPELAEAVGIYVGDGYLRYAGRRKELDISGNYEEKEYYGSHVIPLFNSVFGLNIMGRYFPSRRTYGFVIRDIGVIEVFKNLGFPSGNKSLSVRIPTSILNNSDPSIHYSFLRGYFDTDGCLTYMKRCGRSYVKNKQTYHCYPRLLLTSVSERLLGDMKVLLQRYNFRFYSTIYQHKQEKWNDSHRVYLVGPKNLKRWMDLIGIKNSTKLSRFQIWTKYGFCSTNTTYNQRINILSGKLSIHSFYNGPIV